MRFSDKVMLHRHYHITHQGQTTASPEKSMHQQLTYNQKARAKDFANLKNILSQVDSVEQSTDEEFAIEEERANMAFAQG